VLQSTVLQGTSEVFSSALLLDCLLYNSYSSDVRLQPQAFSCLLVSLHLTIFETILLNSSGCSFSLYELPSATSERERTKSKTDSFMKQTQKVYMK